MAIFIIILAAALLIAAFALKNGQLVIVDFFFTKIQMSQAVLILSAALLGALIFFLIYLINRFKMSRRIHQLEKELAKEKEMSEQREKDRVASETRVRELEEHNRTLLAKPTIKEEVVPSDSRDLDASSIQKIRPNMEEESHNRTIPEPKSETQIFKIPDEFKDL